ncbi:hypothetical protein BAE44_0000812 [Dichanthelium oligosanthes]|uniref:Protein BIC1 n=1 Tax=Dichanthelium oligosanthes TaxID=888268 RepID=A0A1E5WL73_9POAL|nr:hypothetical protein BAE44_0000812 [Dichanthelium oligosanthes]
MASSGDVVGAVLEPVEVEQPAEACDGESGLPATTTTEGSQPPILQEEQRDDAAPDAAHLEVAVPAAEVSASEEPAEKQKPLVAKEVVEPEAAAAVDQESTRERLKRHRREMAGRVWVPELWGQEKLLKDWVDCAVFDRPMVPAGLLTARRALIAECCTRRPDRRTSPASSAGSSPLRVHNGCS